MAALKAAPAAVDLLLFLLRTTWISRHTGLRRCRPRPSPFRWHFQHPIWLPRPIPLLFLGTLQIALNRPTWKLTAPTNKVNLFQRLIRVSKPVLTNLYCLQRHGRPLKNPSASGSQVPSLSTSLHNQSDLRKSTVWLRRQLGPGAREL